MIACCWFSRHWTTEQQNICWIHIESNNIEQLKSSASTFAYRRNVTYTVYTRHTALCIRHFDWWAFTLSQSLHHCRWLLCSFLLAHSLTRSRCRCRCCFYSLVRFVRYVIVCCCRVSLWIPYWYVTAAAAAATQSLCATLCMAFVFWHGSFNHGKWIFWWTSSNQCKSTFGRNRRRAPNDTFKITVLYSFVSLSFPPPLRINKTKQNRVKFGIGSVCVCVYTLKLTIQI